MIDLHRVITRERARTTPAATLALLCAAIAGGAYAATLLPGLDLGDTASFQTVVVGPLLVARHAYPLYFALGKLFVFVLGGEPAYALNVLSATAGAATAGAFAWLAWELTQSRLAAVWASLLFVLSYTFWSQAVIAEVYTLEAFFIAAVLAAALRWWRVPTRGRLVTVYFLYALSFGNHLSMILFAPALTWLLWRGRRRATFDPFSARGLVIAFLVAAGGALQYAWNLHGLWLVSAPHGGLDDLLSAFWFDVTKADWRESLVGTVPTYQWTERLAMYWWDLRQQFGVAGVCIAALGAVALGRASAAPSAMLWIAWTVTFVFAFLYNVGDTHVFLLPSHLVVAAFAACGVASLVRMANSLRPATRTACVVLLCLVPASRAADTWPAVDRSGDHRAQAFAEASLVDLTPGNSVYVADMNWQNLNALAYEVAVHRPELPRVHSTGVMWHFPEFVSRNHELGRDVVLTREAAASIRGVYGTYFEIQPDPRAHISSIGNITPVAPGTSYVLTLLTPLRGVTYDAERIQQVARALGTEVVPGARYIVIAGVAGAQPLLKVARNRPFRASARLPIGRVMVRMDAWLPADTMRRAGFGHVIVDGRHRLTIERGATLGIFDEKGTVRAHAYEGGSFTLEPRYRIPVLR